MKIPDDTKILETWTTPGTLVLRIQMYSNHETIYWHIPSSWNTGSPKASQILTLIVNSTEIDISKP